MEGQDDAGRDIGRNASEELLFDAAVQVVAEAAEETAVDVAMGIEEDAETDKSNNQYEDTRTPQDAMKTSAVTEEPGTGEAEKAAADINDATPHTQGEEAATPASQLINHARCDAAQPPGTIASATPVPTAIGTMPTTTAEQLPFSHLEMVHTSHVQWQNPNRPSIDTGTIGIVAIPHRSPVYVRGGQVHRISLTSGQEIDVMACDISFCSQCGGNVDTTTPSPFFGKPFTHFLALEKDGDYYNFTGAPSVHNRFTATMREATAMFRSTDGAFRCQVSVCEAINCGECLRKAMDMSAAVNNNVFNGNMDANGEGHGGFEFDLDAEDGRNTNPGYGFPGKVNIADDTYGGLVDWDAPIAGHTAMNDAATTTSASTAPSIDVGVTGSAVSNLTAKSTTGPAGSVDYASTHPPDGYHSLNPSLLSHISAPLPSHSTFQSNQNQQHASSQLFQTAHMNNTAQALAQDTDGTDTGLAKFARKLGWK